MADAPFWKTKTLEEMTDAEWEQQIVQELAESLKLMRLYKAKSQNYLPVLQAALMQVAWLKAQHNEPATVDSVGADHVPCGRRPDVGGVVGG